VKTRLFYLSIFCGTTPIGNLFNISLQEIIGILGFKLLNLWEVKVCLISGIENVPQKTLSFYFFNFNICPDPVAGTDVTCWNQAGGWRIFRIRIYRFRSDLWIRANPCVFLYVVQTFFAWASQRGRPLSLCLPQWLRSLHQLGEHGLWPWLFWEPRADLRSFDFRKSLQQHPEPLYWEPFSGQFWYNVWCGNVHR